jgi:hypothetical protein
VAGPVVWRPARARLVLLLPPRLPPAASPRSRGARRRPGRGRAGPRATRREPGRPGALAAPPARAACARRSYRARAQAVAWAARAIPHAAGPQARKGRRGRGRAPRRRPLGPGRATRPSPAPRRRSGDLGRATWPCPEARERPQGRRRAARPTPPDLAAGSAFPLRRATRVCVGPQAPAAKRLLPVPSSPSRSHGGHAEAGAERCLHLSFGRSPRCRDGVTLAGQAAPSCPDGQVPKGADCH